MSIILSKAPLFLFLNITPISSFDTITIFQNFLMLNDKLIIDVLFVAREVFL